MTVIPNPFAIFATRVPMLPSPYRPRVLPLSSLPTRPALTSDQAPARVAVAAGDDLPGQREGQGEDVFGDGLAVLSGGDGDPHPVVGGGGDVDVVAADAVPGNDLQLRGPGDHLGGEGFGAEHDRVDVVADVVVADRLRSVSEVDGTGFGEAGEDVGVDWVGHVDGGHGGLLGGHMGSNGPENGLAREMLGQRRGADCGSCPGSA